MMSKLQHYGVRGLPLQLLLSYLSNRLQKVLFNGKISKSLFKFWGVTRFNLGAFIIFNILNDFPKCFPTGKPLTFIDDTNIFFSEKTFEKLFAVANQLLKNIGIIGSHLINNH